VIYCRQEYLIAFVNFYLTCAGFASGRAYAASLPRCFLCPSEPDVVTLSSSVTEEALEQLFSGPPLDPVSHVLKPPCSFDSDQFNDWPKANDIVVSVYVALIVDASSSRISTVNAQLSDQESCADISFSRQSRSRATLS
jgi:hypothetical protein